MIAVDGRGCRDRLRGRIIEPGLYVGRQCGLVVLQRQDIITALIDKLNRSLWRRASSMRRQARSK